MGYQTQAAFAKRYGLDPKRWNHYETGRIEVPLNVARMLARQIPGLSPGWITDAATGDLSLEMARKLGVLPPGAS
jgi:DNA-binding XRE family transcriptional regulator